MQCALPLSTKVQDRVFFYYIDTDAFDLKKRIDFDICSILSIILFFCQHIFYEMRKSIQIMK